MGVTTPIHFGIEQEHFVFHCNGETPSHEVIDELWRLLLGQGFQIQATNPSGRVLSIWKQTEWGPLVILNDSCTHIVEVAFPKIDSLDTFRKLYEETWEALEQHMRSLDLQIRYGGALPQAPAITHWRPKNSDPTGERLIAFTKREPIYNPLFSPDFPACFAATHVSLNIPDDQAIAMLPYLYAHEHHVPQEFSNSKSFQGISAHCIRPLAWYANFQQPYPLLGIPDPIPRTLEDYSMARAACTRRDYSFIAIRDTSRVEFRSSCSQNSLDDILRLLQFRLETVQSFDPSHAYVIESPKERFLSACG